MMQDVTVRWESALPLREALKNQLPEDFANRYVISVNGLPLGGRRRRIDDDNSSGGSESAADLLDRLKSGATLQAKGKEPLQPGVIQRTPAEDGFLFGFSKDMLPLTAGDRDVTFTLDTGTMTLKARFDPKEMLYRGQLAI